MTLSIADSLKTRDISGDKPICYGYTYMYACKYVSSRVCLVFVSLYMHTLQPDVFRYCTLKRSACAQWSCHPIHTVYVFTHACI